MRKLLTLFLTLALGFSLAACGGVPSDTTTPPPAESSAPESSSDPAPVTEPEAPTDTPASSPSENSAPERRLDPAPVTEPEAPADNTTTPPPAENSAPEKNSDPAPETEPEAPADPTAEGQTPIMLTIGDAVLEAYLNDSVPAQSLAAQLPLTVSLNDSDNDFCGDSVDIDYTEADVQFGYQNGDLALWTPASNFVIFVSDEGSSANTGDLVILGHVTSSQGMLDALEGRLDVTISLAE